MRDDLQVPVNLQTLVRAAGEENELKAKLEGLQALPGLLAAHLEDLGRRGKPSSLDRSLTRVQVHTLLVLGALLEAFADGEETDPDAFFADRVAE